MRCLYCGKELVDPTPEEMESQWHTGCTKKFFGMTLHPVLDLDDSILQEIARKNGKRRIYGAWRSKKAFFTFDRRRDGIEVNDRGLSDRVYFKTTNRKIFLSS